MILSILIAAVCITTSSVYSATIKYDQRQEGEVNVRADLENFVVLLIPTSSSSGLSLLDLITKSIPVKQKGNKKKYHENQTEDEELRHFIETKSAAPYHVDLSKTKANLAKLRPDVNEEILISPTVQLAKDAEKVERVKKAAVVEVPADIYITVKGESFDPKPIPIEEALVVSDGTPFQGKKTII